MDFEQATQLRFFDSGPLRKVYNFLVEDLRTRAHICSFAVLSSYNPSRRWNTTSTGCMRALAFSSQHLCLFQIRKNLGVFRVL